MAHVLARKRRVQWRVTPLRSPPTQSVVQVVDLPPKGPCRIDSGGAAAVYAKCARGVPLPKVIF